MWNDWSNRTAPLRHASCSSRQLLNSEVMGNWYGPAAALRSISTGLPMELILSSSVSIAIDLLPFRKP